MSEHTKEQWRLGKFTGPSSYEKVRETCGLMDIVVDTEIGPYVLASCNINFPEDAKANARRIVACVNACAGIETDHLENHGLPGFAEKISILVRQRDELHSALELLLERTEVPDRDCRCHISPPCNDCVENSGLREAVEFAQAIIAKVK
jgi:hypothetical protein